MLETTEAQFAFMKLKIQKAIGVTTGDAQNGLMQADKVIDGMLQKLRDSRGSAEDQE